MNILKAKLDYLRAYVSNYRTQDQLGYIVFSGVRKANGAKGMRLLVQSTKNLEYVDYRIEKFLESMIVSLLSYQYLKLRSH